MRGLLVAGGLLLVASCGYYNGYNGIYGANKLASQARRSEREGRPGEAQTYWGQAEVKAESLIARQPRGKWRNDALAIRGEALASLNRCGEALTYLNEAFETATDTEVREITALALGRCQLALGQPDIAAATLEPLGTSRNEDRRTAARRLRGQALLAMGDYEGALSALDAAGAAPTSSEMLGAMAGLNRGSEVRTAVQELLAQRDTTLLWDTVLAGIGRYNPAMASALLDELSTAGAIPPARLPLLLGLDASRLSGEARERRLREVAELAPQSETGDAARLELARADLRAVGTVDELRPFPARFREIATAGQTSATAARTLSLITERIVVAADSVTPATPQGDLRLFFAAELARDSLQAPRLSLDLFRRVVVDWPDGAFAPKALLAGRTLDPSYAELTDSLLRNRYAQSPYVVAALGGDRAAMRQLDDSMATYQRTVTGRSAGEGTGARRRAPVDEDEDRPAAAKRPTPKQGRQVEEPQ